MTTHQPKGGTMNKWLDILIPRFKHDIVVVDFNTDQTEFEIRCCEADLDHGEYFDHLGYMRSFNFFGWGLFGRMHGVTYVNSTDYWNERGSKANG